MPLTPNERSVLLDQYVKLLQSGEVVAFPTETVYGLGADAQNPDAIKKVFKTKGRPSDNPLIVHVSDKKQVEQFAAEISDDALKLMDTFWPGPLTLIFKKNPDVLDIITAGLDTVALRWPKHPLSQELIARAGPLVAPSANSSGKPSPTKAEHVKEDFREDFPVVDAGETDIGLESTVLDISSEPYQIYRPGAISADDISKVIGKKIKQAVGTTESEAAKSPGTKYSHYTPEATVHWISKFDTTYVEEALYLMHSRPGPRKNNRVIQYEGNYKQMAHELYDRFRQADHQQLEYVFVEPFSDKQLQNPLVQALQNRISKALGIPFNLACYSALTMAVANEVGLDYGTFAHTIVDAHIYENHVDGLKEQLTREPRPLPTLEIADKPIDDLEFDDFELKDYNPHDSIKFEVAV